MPSSVVSFPVTKREATRPDQTSGLMRSVMTWTRDLLQQIADGPMPAVVTYGDRILLERAIDAVTSYEASKTPSTSKQVRDALLRLHHLIVTKDRLQVDSNVVKLKGRRR